jgi:hypothetical protein
MGISWWRMAFIFGPAIARGDVSSLGLYTPFIFGKVSLTPSRALLVHGFVGGQKPKTPEQTVGTGTASMAATAASDKTMHVLTSALAGFLLGRVVKQYKKHQKLRGWPLKVPSDLLWSWRYACLREIFFVGVFLLACHLLKTETRSLFNFFLSSFVCPMLRFCIPYR